jgi:hypothetical protein
MGILEVIGNVGGVQQVLALFISILVMSYNELSFDISVINFMYLVKTKDASLKFLERNLTINFCDKIKLLTNICANKKMQRFIKKGKKRLGREFDLMYMIK